MVSKYKKVKYLTCQTMDSGCFSECRPELGWVELSRWTQWVGRGVPTLPGAADRLEAVQIWFLIQRCVSSSTAGLWGMLTAELQQTVKPGWGWHRLSCSAEYPQGLPVKLHLAKEWPEPKGNRSHPGCGPACSLPSPHHTEVRSPCPETLGHMKTMTGQERGLNGQESIPVLKLWYL